VFPTACELGRPVCLSAFDAGAWVLLRSPPVKGFLPLAGGGSEILRTQAGRI